MTTSDIKIWTKAEPFRPFRITMNAGRHYDVLHPEFVMLFVDSILIGKPKPDDEGVFSGGQMIGLSLVDRIEALADLVAREK